MKELELDKIKEAFTWLDRRFNPKANDVTLPLWTDAMNYVKYWNVLYPVIVNHISNKEEA